MKTSLLLLIVVVCAGCAGRVWTNPSKGQQEFYEDSARCEAMANSAGNGQIMKGDNSFASGWNEGSAIGSTISRNRIFKNCMMGAGWRLENGDRRGCGFASGRKAK